MGTTGWTMEHVLALQKKHEPKRRGRRTLAEITADEQDQRKERELQSEVERWLTAEQVSGRILCWYHRPDVAMDRPEQRGLPDLIIGLRAGLTVAIELKRPDGTGRIRPEQQVWLRAWGERGRLCLSLAQVQEFLGRMGAAQ